MLAHRGIFCLAALRLLSRTEKCGCREFDNPVNHRVWPDLGVVADDDPRPNDAKGPNADTLTAVL